MAKYRIEVEEVTTVSRQVWVEAENEADAREQVADLIWREFDPFNEVIETTVVMVEECND